MTLWVPTLALPGLSLARTFRDRLDPRDWLRPWRDPPGYLPKQQECCCSDEPCTVTVGCCAVAIPCRLHAAIAITGVCSTTAELDLCNYTPSTGHWYGLKTISGYTWYVDLECQTGGSAPNHFRANILVTGSGCGGGAVIGNAGLWVEPDCADAWESGHSYPLTMTGVNLLTAPSSYSCNPLSLVFSGIFNGPYSQPGSCACGKNTLASGESYTTTLTITEPA